MAVALALAALSGSTLAQYGGGMGGGGGGGMGGRHGRGGGDTTGTSRSTDMPTSPQARASQVNDKFYDLRLRLQLTPEQGKLWDTLSDQVWDMSVHASLPRAAADNDGLSALQTVQRRAVEAQDRALRLQKLADCVDRLYAALTSDQRHIADQYLPALIP